MALFVYKGIPAKAQAEQLKKYMAIVKPQDPRARPPLYYIDQRDNEELKDLKRERKKKYLADREAEYKKELAAMSEKTELMDSLGKKYVFEKDKPVEIPETSSLYPRLEAKVKSGATSPYCYWERVEKQTQAEKQAPVKEHKEEKTKAQ